MTDQLEFVWTFPCYILARDFRTDPESGNVSLDVHTRIVAPDVAGDGNKHVAIFTDADLAEMFRERSPMAADMQPVEFATPASLKAFLDAIQVNFQFAAIDLNPQTRVCRSFLIGEMLPALDRWINDLDES